MEKEQVIAGFNRWLEEFIRNPQKFTVEQTLIQRHLLEKANGEKVSYGELCEATLTRYMNS